MARIQTLNPSEMGSPRWAGDYMGRESLIPGGARLDVSQFMATDAVAVTVGTGGAEAGDTAIPVTALAGPIPNGTVLHFGVGVFAVLTAPAATGATSLTVSPLRDDVDEGATATYGGSSTVTVRSGTVVGRTFAERDARTGYGPAEASDDEIYLVAFDVPDAERNPDIVLYRHNRVVKENYLPDFATLPAPLQAAVRSRYACTTGEG